MNFTKQNTLILLLLYISGNYAYYNFNRVHLLCQNWCHYPGYAAYICCDFYYRPKSSVITEQRCPVIDDCYTDQRLINAIECQNDNDCKRKEKCCNNPCKNIIVCLEVTKNQESVPRYCTQIKDCEQWMTENPNPKMCTNHTDGCSDKECCCPNPCVRGKTCLKKLKP